MRRERSADQTRQEWLTYYASMAGDANDERFRQEFERTTLKHTWYNSIRILSELGQLKDGDSVLEAGCGWGRMVLGLVDRHTGLQITGMDLTHRALSRAQSLLGAGQNGNRIRWVAGNVEGMPWRDDRFDFVYSARVFQHLNAPEQGVRELIRVLKPGGRFVIFLQNRLCPLNATYYSRLYTPGQVKAWFRGVSTRELRVRSMDFYPGFLKLLPLGARMECERVLERVPLVNLFGGKVVAWGRK